MDTGKNTLEQILSYKILDLGNYDLTLSRLLLAILILFATKALLVLVKRSLLKAKRLKDHRDEGDLFSVIQIFNYTGWTISTILILDTLGIKITVLLTGSAALLVGVGLGLQQTFNDFISGIILLIEGKTKVGDILQVDDDVIVLKDIGLRTTEGVDRDNIAMIIPNSKIINDKVINWSHQQKKTRFRIDIGVAYDSDVDLVVKILESSALEHPDIIDKKSIEARFVDFGESSLEFQLLFYSMNVFRVEKVKSDIRKIMIRNLIENNITIPFPQMDVHLKQQK